MARIRNACAILPAMILAACAYPGKDAENGSSEDHPHALLGTKWELKEVSNSGQSGPVASPVPAGLYTLTVNADGNATFRFDCNRGFGKWSTGANSPAQSGAITFSDIGVTKALCPPGSIDDQVIAAFSRFDAYKIAKSQLTLSADQGRSVYVWIPATEMDAEASD